MKPLILLFLILTNPAFAVDPCDDLWLSRNIIYDRHGYCFQSALGRAIFDNKACHKTPAELDKANAEKIAKIKAWEDELLCKMDTNRTRLDVDAVHLRFLLTEQPLANNSETQCVRYRGAVSIVLYAGPSTDTAPLGTIEIGDTVQWAHETQNGWEYVTIMQNDQTTKIGWTNANIQDCEGLAG
ncbi:MAG: hypothetical protein COB84_04235 [Rhodobacteraceae bacterium]|nr:MAG: hypothetical protein COB84_04235 [Paracoccaceae bacterium]